MSRRGHIQLKSEAELAAMRLAGLVVADALAAMRAAVAPGVSTLDLDSVAAEVLHAAGAAPSFLGYHGYPATICASVNDEVVHGIPSRRALQEGDVVSVDVGAIVDGWHGDAAVTVPVGDIDPAVADLLLVCEDALWAGLAAARPGHRLGDIGAAVEGSVPSGYGLVREYTGHGIGTHMHEEPSVPNHGRPGRGVRLTAGLALAVEPMVTRGRPQVRVLDDGWTVVTRDRSWAAHFEHTVAITPAGPWVLTAPDGGASRLGIPPAGVAAHAD